jgi:biotin operon repressor
MSNKISNLVQTKKIGSLTKKAILMYMADKASDDGSGIWVSKKNMAADLEMTDRAVRIHIKDMIAMGVLVEAGQRQCKTGYTVDYTINVEVVGSLGSTREATEQHAPLNDVHPYPCMSFTPTPEPRSPKPPIEPSKEPNTSSKDDEVNYYFDQLWALYPRKVGKGQARKAFKAASKKADFYDLLPKLMDYVQTLEGKDKQYIPHLATWLNGERWEDEVEV